MLGLITCFYLFFFELELNVHVNGFTLTLITSAPCSVLSILCFHFHPFYNPDLLVMSVLLVIGGFPNQAGSILIWPTHPDPNLCTLLLFGVKA